MTWHQFVYDIAVASDRTYVETDRFLRLVWSEVVIAARSGGLVVPGFGSFRKKTCKSRRILNPQTGKPMRLPAQETVGFRASKALRRKRGKK